MKVNFYATFRAAVGKKTVEIDLPAGSTLRALLAAVLNAYPLLRPNLVDAQGELLGYVHLFLNGRDAPWLPQGMDTPIDADSTLDIFPPVGGG